MNERINALLRKAAILTSTGGQLSTENAQAFITTVFKLSEPLAKVTRYIMAAASRNIDSVAFASRQMRGATENVEITQTGTTTFPRRTLTTKEVQIAPDISKQFFEENIEGAGAESKLRDMFATAFANDWLDLSINGDEDLTTDNFLKINNGWLDLALADGNVNDANLNGLQGNLKAAFVKVLKALPVKYRSNKSGLVFLVSPDVEEDYRDQVAERNTALGDAALIGDRNISAKGIEVYPIYSWPDNYIALTFWRNLAVGIGRDISVDYEWKPRKRMYEYTITAKVDAEYAVGEMIALGSFSGF